MELNDLPQVSSPLPWHGQVWAQLNEQLANRQLPHALLLVGSKHTGKAQLALALARLLLCSKREGTLNCGQCHACKLSASGGHGDFRWVNPQEKSRVIKIDQVREVVGFTAKTAAFGLRKVIVFAPADTMNVFAFNALLKSLEEPANDTYLILVCSSLYAVPATIRSRCQIIRLPGPNTELSEEWLNLTTGAPGKSRELLALADNRPLLAQQLHDNGSIEEFARRRVGLRALLCRQITPPQAGALWGDIEADLFLEQLAEDLQRLLTELPMDLLASTQGKATFRLVDDVVALRRAVSHGANPSRQLLIDALMSRIHRELGTGLVGDNIPAGVGEAGL